MRPVDPAGGADGAAGDLRLHPRLDLPRRGRTDPPADQPARCRCARSRACPCCGRPTPTRRPRPGALAIEHRTGPTALSLTGRSCRSWPRPPTCPRGRRRAAATCSRDRRGATRAHPDRQRLGGGSWRSRRRPSSPQRESARASSACPAGSSSTPRRPLPRSGPAGGGRPRLAIEAGSTFGWERYVGAAGEAMGVDRFGASAPFQDLAESYGFTVGEVTRRARELLER